MDLPYTHSTTISEFYKGKNIFMTGATGFFGKMLIYKLLHSCPDIGNIYAVMRPKRQKSIKERLDVLMNDKIFDAIRERDPHLISKVIPLSGDCSELKLGLSETDYQTITSSVNVMFHCAASVRFDDPLKSAILLNTRGTREVAQLALQTKALSMLVHVSTAYCNCIHGSTIKEQIYPAPYDWRKAIKSAEELDNDLLALMSEKYIGPYPNTYTFTKALGEHVIKDMCEGKIPTIITRPSIVINSAAEPAPGWVDNFNGPIGLLIACSKGLLRCGYTDDDIYLDYIPVDIVIKGMIVGAWYYAVNKPHEKVEVLHICSGYDKWISAGDMINTGKKITHTTLPVNNSVWIPKGTNAKIYAYYYICIIIFHLLPAFFLDMGLKLAGRKPMLVKIQRKLFIAQNVLSYFFGNEWTFCNDNYLALKGNISKKDQDDWSLDFITHLPDVAYNFLLGARRYLLNEPDETIPQAKVHMRRLYWVDKIAMTILYGSLIWLIIHFGLIGKILNYVFKKPVLFFDKMKDIHVFP